MAMQIISRAHVARGLTYHAERAVGSVAFGRFPCELVSRPAAGAGARQRSESATARVCSRARDPHEIMASNLYVCHRPLYPPSGVTHATAARLTGALDADDLVVVRGASLLEVHSVSAAIWS